MISTFANKWNTLYKAFLFVSFLVLFALSFVGGEVQFGIAGSTQVVQARVNNYLDLALPCAIDTAAETPRPVSRMASVSVGTIILVERRGTAPPELTLQTDPVVCSELGAGLTSSCRFHLVAHCDDQVHGWLSEYSVHLLADSVEVGRKPVSSGVQSKFLGGTLSAFYRPLLSSNVNLHSEISTFDIPASSVVRIPAASAAPLSMRFPADGEVDFFAKAIAPEVKVDSPFSLGLTYVPSLFDRMSSDRHLQLAWTFWIAFVGFLKFAPKRKDDRT